MTKLVIAKDIQIGKDYVYEKTCGRDVYMKASCPYWELRLYSGEVWKILLIDDIPRGICGMTVEEVHYMEDLTIKEMYDTIEYIAPLLCSREKEGCIYICGKRIEFK